MSNYRHSQNDGNQTQITRELRARGFRVDLVFRVKKLYDAVVTGRMFGTNEPRTVRVEIKMPGAKLTPDEREYHEAEPYPETLIIATKTEHVLAWFGHIEGEDA